MNRKPYFSSIFSSFFGYAFLKARTAKLQKRPVAPNPFVFIRVHSWFFSFSGNDPITGHILGTGEFHAPLVGERGEEFVERGHDLGVAVDLEVPVFFDRNELKIDEKWLRF
ncbi:hypothetical protein [Halofilum ochraceum]|uniref:hypothetical protein n=1 Tax=Halofilum ochraceum TaxID=1611323 RepID=UPI003CCB9565